MRDRDKIERIIEEQGTDKSRLVGILQAVQAECNWLPEDALRIIAERLEVPLTDVFGIATFYKSFSLKPRGKHLVRVCLGTACHVRGGPRIMETAESFLGIKADETTADYKFTLEGVNCLGCCALGPVMVEGNEYYGNLPPRKVEKILREYEHGDRSNGDRRSERKEEERD
ncbi:NAD(P)H-dependent oxidoreductase subunit E [Methanosarcinales archaeon]|nr:MAG: NAD(P)H-dependent oxidoreductase subunit E [Methanosarcinales archaeon]